MEIKFKKKAIKLLENNIESFNSINNENKIDIFDTIISFSKNNLSILATKLLNHCLKYQTRTGEFQFKKTSLPLSPVYFLKTMNEYLKQEENRNKKTIKKYIKSIKKSISYLENLDEKFLLLHKQKQTKKIFFAKTNAILISFVDELSDTLNYLEYPKQADSLFMLKGKIELGFNRYFYHQKSKILLDSFQENTNFKIADTFKTINILTHYNVDIGYSKELLNEAERELSKQTEVKNIIYYLILLNQTKNSTYKTQLKKYIKVLENFCEKILSTKEYITYLEIKKSIEPNYDEKIIKLKTQKKVLFETNSIKIANLILRL